MGTHNERAVYEWVIISDDLVHEWVRFFKDQNRVGFEILARTPVPKLSPNYPPPTHTLPTQPLPPRAPYHLDESILGPVVVSDAV